MTKLKTCANCESVRAVGEFKVVGCDRTKLVVPAHTDYRSETVQFFRVPTECPRPDEEVIKREYDAGDYSVAMTDAETRPLAELTR